MKLRAAALVTLGATVASSCIAFRPPVSHQASVTAAHQARRVEAIDVTGNGAIDVIVLTTHQLVRMEVCGVDCLVRNESIPLTQPTGMAAGDLNGDGIGDVAVTMINADPIVFFGGAALSGRPAGLTVTDSATIPSSDALGFKPDEVEIGDFDGDENPDLLVRAAELWYHPGDGAGGFGPRVVVQSLLPSQASRSYEVGDLDGDGDDEVLIRVGSLFGLSYSIFGANNPFTDPAPIGSPFALGDINGDGRDDIVSPSGSVMQVQLSTGTGFSTVVQPAPLPLAFGLGQLTIRDVDTNGTGDIVGVGNQRLSWFNGAGDGTASVVFGNVRLDQPIGTLVSDLAFGDLDGNGRPEAIIATSGGSFAEISVLRNSSFIPGDPV